MDAAVPPEDEVRVVDAAVPPEDEPRVVDAEVPPVGALLPPVVERALVVLVSEVVPPMA